MAEAAGKIRMRPARRAAKAITKGFSIGAAGLTVISLLGAAAAMVAGTGVLAIRKPGKLPGDPVCGQEQQPAGSGREPEVIGEKAGAAQCLRLRLPGQRIGRGGRAVLQGLGKQAAQHTRGMQGQGQGTGKRAQAHG